MLDIDGDGFDESKTPVIVSIDGIFVPFFVESMRPKGATSWLLKLEGIDSEQAARQFVNETIYMRREDIAEFGDDSEGAPAELFVGYSVEDTEYGRIGVIERIDLDSPNPLFYVRSDKDDETILIPIADELIKDLDHDRRTIVMHLPAGLIDINRKTSE